ncbi:MAG: YdcF family protein [Erysipelotrichaceae bacterium]|nr:YdcF family protein [Erysipelotrichaceae bacterium]
MDLLILGGIVLFWWAMFTVSFKDDRSRYRNCYFLVLAIFHTIFFLAYLAGDHMFDVMIVLAIIFGIAVIIVPFFLIFNGITMMKREGKGLSTLLSLFFGILIGIGEITTFLTMMSIVFAANDNQVFVDLVKNLGLPFSVFSVSVIYVSVSFLIFMIYTLFLQIVPRKRDFDYVIIHGSGLIHGNKVSKLLSDRIDKALEVYHKDPTPPILIPSGGQGPDEDLAEARAMADYMIAKGIPTEKIVPEDTSTTTYENLVNSKKIIEERGGGDYIALVTSNYHVYRALRHCRKIGLKCTGIGSHVAFYYWPSALIREYVAVHSEFKHLVILILGWLAVIVPLFFTFR